MNKTPLYIGLVILIVAIAAAVWLFMTPAGSPNNTATTTPDGSATTTPTDNRAKFDDLLVVDVPLPNATVSSPLHITGKARGTWYFEASFPVELRNASGTVIAQTHADALGDWMTTDYVAFSATTTFAAQPHGSTGTLVLKNDNPSGDPAKDKKVEIPVVFQ